MKTIQDLENKIKGWFLVKDSGIISLVCATVIAHKFSGDPVWLFIIAPPSGLKSELIRALNKTDNIYPLSSLTPHTLISGQKNGGKETSLLFKVGQSIFTFKDFTTVLELYEAARQEILSQLREVYDGQYAKSFGTGEEIKWIGKIGFIAGVTEAVDLYQGMYSILGERFLQYRMTQPDRKEATRKGIQNADGIQEIRNEMEEILAEYINNFPIPEEPPELTEEWKEEIIELSDFATSGRSGIRRDSKDREITHVFAPEMPIRFSKQLTLLAKAFVLMGIEDRGRNILRKIALDSLPKNRIKIFTVLLKNSKALDIADSFGIDPEMLIPNSDQNQWKTEEVATCLNLPTTTVRRLLQDLNALNFVDRLKNVGGNADVWVLKTEYVDFFKKYYPHFDDLTNY